MERFFGLLKNSKNKFLRGANNSRFGTHLSEKTKEKLSVTQKGERNHNFGKKHTTEAKAKMRASAYRRIGKRHPHKGVKRGPMPEVVKAKIKATKAKKAAK